MKKEPAWIDHDGSDTCPVPTEHDTEVMFRSKDTDRDDCPYSWYWKDIIKYRDWTNFENSKTNPDLLKALATVEALHIPTFDRIDEANEFIKVAVERIEILKCHIKTLEAHLESLKVDR